MNEIWKTIIYKGKKTKYEISNLARVRNANTYHYKVPHTRKDGYTYYQLHIDGKIKKVNTHILVANAFCSGKTVSKNEVNHKDGNKLNNLPENLEWVTRQENMQHAVRMNLLKNKSGFDHPSNKYTPDNIRDLINNYNKVRNIKQAAILSSIEPSTAYDVLHGEKYKEILDEMNFIPLPYKVRIDYSLYIDEIIDCINKGMKSKEILEFLNIPYCTPGKLNHIIRKLRKSI